MGSVPSRQEFRKKALCYQMLFEFTFCRGHYQWRGILFIYFYGILSKHQFVFHYGGSQLAPVKWFEYCLRHARNYWQDCEKNQLYNLHCSDKMLKETLSVVSHPYPSNFKVISSSHVPKVILRDMIKLHPFSSCECPLADSNTDSSKRCLNSLCHNFSTRTECDAACSCGNRRIPNAWIDKELDSKFVVLPVADHIGFGLHTRGVTFQKDDFVIEYVGKVYTYSMLEKKKKKNDGCYLMSIDSNLLVDAFESGNLSRFINQGCSPNI